MPAAPIARPQQQSFRPPAISIMYSGMWSFASYQLYLLGHNGWEWGTLAAFATGGMAIGQFIQAANDRFKVGGHRRKVKRFKAGKMKHGKSRFGTSEDVAVAKILSDKQGIFLGTIRKGKRAHRDVFYDDEGSLSIIAPPGESKTMSIVVPTLLANPEQNLIINDPAGEVYSICNLALQKAGYEVSVLTPYPNEVSAQIGQKVTDVGIDVFSSLKSDMHPGRVRGKIENIMRWVMPGEVNMDEKSKFFYRSARMLGGFFSLKELSEGRKPTLPAIRSHLMEGPAFIHDAFNDAEGSTAFGGVYEELAKSLGGVLTAAPQQFAGGFGIAEQCLDPYDHFSSMGQHTSGSSFDPSSLKQTNKKTALFLISTLEKMKTGAPTTAMTLTYLFDTLAADPQKGRCTAIIDECGSLVMPQLADSLLFYRKTGLRCLMIWQDLAGQAEKIHGKTGMRQIMAASKLKIGMGLQEPETLQMFSKLCGNQSIDDMSLTDRAMLTDAMPDLSHGLNHRSVPLLRPEEIQRMGSDQLLVVGGDLFPLQLHKLPYWKRASWKNIAGPSPFYRG